MAKSTFCLLAACIISAAIFSLPDPCLMAEETLMRLRMKDGSFAVGYVRPASAANHIGWQMQGFRDPFEFEARALRSISAVAESADEPDLQTATAAGEKQMFELTDGGLLMGSLRSIEDEWVLVDSPLLGQLRISRERLVAISDASYAGQVVYQGPVNEDSWKTLSEATDWVFEGGAAVTNQAGAVLVGSVDMPSKAQVDVVLSWKGVPDFVFSFGTTATNRVSPVEQVPAAARLEVWDKQLALVREVDSGADIALVSDLTGSSPRIELTLLIDQEAGVVTVCDSHGRPLDSVQAKAKRKIIRDAVHLVNHGSSLTLESCEVREWDGRVLSVRDTGGIVRTSDDQEYAASVAGFNDENQTLQLRSDDPNTPKEIPIAKLRRGDFFSPANASERSPRTDSQTLQLEVVFRDRSRLSGRWLAADEDQLVLQVDGVTQPEQELGLTFDVSQIRGLIGNDERYLGKAAEDRVGTLKLEDAQLTGYLQTAAEGQPAGLVWHPLNSRNASLISMDASGAIVYRKQLPRVAPSSKTSDENQARPVPMINIFLGGRAPAANQRGKPEDKSDSNEEREILFRIGDSIYGVVEAIDESGMKFRSQQTSTSFAAHDQIQSVSLNPQRHGTDFDDELIERLMTVPRSMKQDPPTHLFVSITGDYLRGRLISFDGETVTAEIRLEVIQIPASQISKIIWLHDREWESNAADPEKANSEDQAEKPFRVHVISSGERGLTFKPVRYEQGELNGQSELLGACSVKIEDVNQILFGRDIAARVREFRQDPWTLSLAQYPRVYLESGDDATAPTGPMSPMVGEPAVDFGLNSLAGEGFRLRTQRDRVVVLDFWASWCGPCIQTMPLVEEVVDEVGQERVHLVAVNIQESRDRVQAAVDRLGLNATVLLDTDGQVAAAYEANAIPQTVIIDRQGVVRYVFVGGGNRFVGQFRAALNEVLAGEVSSGSND